MKTRTYEIVEPIVEYDIYSEQGVDECTDADEISLSEEGFMRGYLSA